MDFILIKMIVGNFMFVIVVHNQFVGVKKECYGMKLKLVVVHKIQPYVLAIGNDGCEVKVNNILYANDLN